MANIQASWEGRYFSLSPIVIVPIFSCIMAEIQEVSPIGESSSVAFSGSVMQAFDRAVFLSEQILRPSSAPHSLSAPRS